MPCFNCLRKITFVVKVARKYIKIWQGGHILAKMKFPVFSLCHINFPCVIFMQKLIICSMNKGHITTVLLHTEAYKLIF